jgi:hypothetical protein
VSLVEYGTIAPNFPKLNFLFRYLRLASNMRLHTHTPLCSFAIGLVSLMSVSTNFSASANAQSFPNDSLPPATSSTGSTQYLVYLPNVANIKQAKILAPDAFVSRLDTGEQVVQLGRFTNLNLAQRRAAQFTQAGLNPQIKTVQSKFASMPAPATIPNSIPPNSAPIPVDTIPNSTPRVDSLPGVPSADFPNSNNPPSNSIEIVRSPQSIPQQSQPIPIQSASQPLPPASQPVANTTQLRYFVIVPTGSVSELQRVQTVAPTAQLRSSYRGTYIEVQGYPDRPSAETLNLTMRRQGFDSRVVYF